MLNYKQLKDFIIKPSLEALDLYNPNLEELLSGICAQESLGGTYIHQDKGTALGIYQMEPKTHDDIWQNYLIKILDSSINLYYKIIHSNNLKIALNKTFFGRITGQPDSKLLMYNLFYATQMAAVFIHRLNRDFPDRANVKDMAKFWKAFWNTPEGKGTTDEFVNNYNKFIKT